LGTFFHTLGSTPAQIALDHETLIPVYDGNPKGTDEKTGTTSNTEIFIHDYCRGFFICRDCLTRAYVQTEGFLTLLTGHGDESANFCHPERTDSGEREIELVVMFERASQGTRSATDAFFRVNKNKFIHHTISLCLVSL